MRFCKSHFGDDKIVNFIDFAYHNDIKYMYIMLHDKV